MLLNFLKKNREIISYLIFGVLTTLVNILVFYLMADVLGISYIYSNIVAWFLSVLFAYLTNRKWVFESKSDKVVKEASLFYLSRLATGVMDMALMYVLIDLLTMNMLASKIIVNVVVVVSNYLLSKLLIFRKGKSHEEN